MKKKNKRLENYLIKQICYDYIIERFLQKKFAVKILINLIFISKLLDSFIFFRSNRYFINSSCARFFVFVYVLN
jgi:hypothetical protein